MTVVPLSMIYTPKTQILFAKFPKINPFRLSKRY